MDKKYQIFISSTYTDLIEERQKVRDAILSMYQIPIGMEMFSAADEEQWEIIKETIDTSDYYVLIIANRYGSVITEGEDAGISYTEKEFRYAKSKDIPVLAFVIDESVPTIKANMEQDPESCKKLEEFKAVVMKDRMIDRWKNADELAFHVTTALHKQIIKPKRPGWIRSDAVDIEKNLRVITDLTERNMDLEKENSRLRSELEKYLKENERKPKLKVSIIVDDGEDVDSINSKLDPYANHSLMNVDEEGRIHIKVKKVYADSVEAEFLPWTKEDTAAYQKNGLKILDEDIEEYNRALPEKSAVQEYLQNLECYLKIKDNGVAVTAWLDNEGTAKASLITITIEFPESIRVFDTDDIENLSEPEKPELPKSPLEKAIERQNTGFGALNQVGLTLSALYDGNTYGGINLAELAIQNYGRINGNESFEVSDNTVYIKTKNELVHTENDNFPGIYIVPLETGEFRIKITVMCSEYLEPEVQYIDVICEEECR